MMKEIDITTNLERRKNISRVAYSTIYVNKNHVGFYSKLGIGFIKKTKSGIRKTLNGRVRWYNTCATNLNDSIRSVRSFYKVNVSSKGWDKIRVRHYNTTEAEEIVRFVEIALDRPDL